MRVHVFVHVCQCPCMCTRAGMGICICMHVRLCQCVQCMCAHACVHLCMCAHACTGDPVFAHTHICIPALAPPSALLPFPIGRCVGRRGVSRRQGAVAAGPFECRWSGRSLPIARKPQHGPYAHRLPDAARLRLRVQQRYLTVRGGLGFASRGHSTWGGRCVRAETVAAAERVW